MKFANRIHEETHRKLDEYLKELFDDPYLDTDNNHFYVRYGSTVLEISNEPYGPEESVVTIMSYCVQGVQREEDLLAGLLELNHGLSFGAFSLVGSDIFLSHSLFGRSLDRSNLITVVAAVATIADDYDDRIADKYGGQTALDRIQDTGGVRRRRTSQS